MHFENSDQLTELISKVGNLQFNIPYVQETIAMAGLILGEHNIIGGELDTILITLRDPQYQKYPNFYINALNNLQKEAIKKLNTLLEEVEVVLKQESKDKINTLENLLEIPSVELRDGEVKYLESLKQFAVFDRQAKSGFEPPISSRKGAQSAPPPPHAHLVVGI